MRPCLKMKRSKLPFSGRALALHAGGPGSSSQSWGAGGGVFLVLLREDRVLLVRPIQQDGDFLRSSKSLTLCPPPGGRDLGRHFKADG